MSYPSTSVVQENAAKLFCRETLEMFCELHFKTEFLVLGELREIK